jgi:AsmA protein
MKKLFKIAAVLVLGLVVLAGIAVVVVPMLVDPQDVKDQLSAKVKEHTGRDLSIPGEVKISVFPWLGATLGQVTLGNAAGFSAPLFAGTERVEVRVKLMPLLERRVEMDTVTVHGLTLNLERNAKGVGNWEDLARDGGGGAPSGSAEGGGEGPAVAGIVVGGLDVRDGTVSFKDARAGQEYTVRNLTLSTGTLTPGSPMDLELGFDLSSASPPLSGRVSASARVDGDPRTQRVQVAGLAVDANLEGDTLPGGALRAALGADVELDGANKTLAVRALKLELLDLVATGVLQATGLDGKPSFTGELAIAQFSPRKLLEGLGQPPIETSDGAVLSKASVNAKISGGADALALKPLTVKLDASTLDGEASVSNFANPAVRFALALDTINLDRYLPPGQEVPPATPGAAAGKAGELPVEALRALDVAGKLTAGKLTVAKLNVTDVTATLNAKSGLIRLSPVAAKLYQGTYSGNIALDARKQTPAISLDEKLTGVQAGPLLKDLQGEEPMTGTANVTAKLNALGTDPDAVKKTLNGNVAFQFLNGAVNGVNIGKMIRDARARLQGGSPAPSDEPARTDFAEVTGTAKVVDGLVTNQDLSAKSPLLRVTGKGSASLPAESIDYRITATLVASSKGQGGKDLADLSGVPIPVHVTGTFAKPEYGLDMEALAQAVAKSKASALVDEQKAKVTETVKENFGDQAGKLLGGDKEGGGGLLKGLLGN